MTLFSASLLCDVLILYVSFFLVFYFVGVVVEREFQAEKTLHTLRESPANKIVYLILGISYLIVGILHLILGTSYLILSILYLILWKKSYIREIIYYFIDIASYLRDIISYLTDIASYLMTIMPYLGNTISH